MPSFVRHRSTSPSSYTYAPGIISSSSKSSGPSSVSSSTKAVGFPDGSPITSISRPLSETEAWTLYYFETHARTCPSCHDPHRVHRSHGRLCSSGHALAQDVALILYSKAEGIEAYAVGDNDALVRVEIPRSYVEIKSLLRAMERSLRKRQTPIISYDRNYYVAPRATHKRMTSTRQEPTSSSASSSSSPPRRTSSTSSHRPVSSYEPFEADLHIRQPARSNSSSSSTKRKSSKNHSHRRNSMGPVTEGLASLAVRSQSSDLSDDSLNNRSTKSSRRSSMSAPSSSSQYATDVRRPSWR